jgi:hypothetical protein
MVPDGLVGIDALSQLFPVGQCDQFVEDCLQSLKTTFVIPRSALYPPLAAMEVQSVRLADLCNFISQLRDALFDWIRHDGKQVQ